MNSIEGSEIAPNLFGGCVYIISQTAVEVMSRTFTPVSYTHLRERYVVITNKLKTENNDHELTVNISLTPKALN